MKMGEEKSSLSLPAVLALETSQNYTSRELSVLRHRPSREIIVKNEDNISTHRSGHSAYTCMHSDTDTDTDWALQCYCN